MSFRWFVYFGALCGAWAGLVGWALGRAMGQPSPLMDAGVKGLFLGLLVALAVGVVDVLWNTAAGQVAQAVLRVAVCILIGSGGGLAGGLVGQALVSLTSGGGSQGPGILGACFLVFGWTLTGLLIGASVGVFEFMAALAAGKPSSGPGSKLLKGLIGGAVGGIAGGTASLFLHGASAALFRDKDPTLVWSPSVVGFVVVGLCIGLMVGLAQVLFREAWIRVQSGFRAGRELLLNKEVTVIGRAEGSDVALFGDAGVSPQHARIVRRHGRFFLEDVGPAGATFLNDAPIYQPAELKSGDVIRVGRSVLSFGERHKRRSDVEPLTMAAAR